MDVARHSMPQGGKARRASLSSAGRKGNKNVRQWLCSGWRDEYLTGLHGLQFELRMPWPKERGHLSQCAFGANIVLEEGV